MESPAVPPVPDAKPSGRQLTTIDLGGLRPLVAEAAAKAGLGMGGWIRSVLERELVGKDQGNGGRSAGGTIGAADETPTAAGVYRAWFDAELTGKLDEVVRRNGLRSRADALRVLIEGVRADRDGASAEGSLAEAARVLGESNDVLVSTGRSVELIAKAVGDGGGLTRQDQEALRATLKALRAHREEAAKLVALIRPKPGKGGRRTARVINEREVD
jgi:hypothetical protein